MNSSLSKFQVLIKVEIVLSGYQYKQGAVDVPADNLKEQSRPPSVPTEPFISLDNYSDSAGIVTSQLAAVSYSAFNYLALFSNSSRAAATEDSLLTHRSHKKQFWGREVSLPLSPFVSASPYLPTEL